MQHLKMLGLAAVAAVALAAFLAPGSASATVLCKVTRIPNNACGAANHWSTGTAVKLDLATGTKAKFSAIWATIECSQSEIEVPTTNTGGSAETVDGNVSKLTFANCTCGGGVTHVTLLEKGQLELHHIAGTNNATVTSKNTKWTNNCTALGTQCIFGTGAVPVDIGTLTASTHSGNGEHAVLDVETTLTRFDGANDEGSFICGSTGKWTASYTVTNPKELFVTAS